MLDPMGARWVRLPVGFGHGSHRRPMGRVTGLLIDPIVYSGTGLRKVNPVKPDPIATFSYSQIGRCLRKIQKITLKFKQ
jgi:hypothetical protein